MRVSVGSTAHRLLVGVGVCQSQFKQGLTQVCEPLYLLITKKYVSFTTIARSFHVHWHSSAFLHLNTSNFFEDATTIYYWCALIEYNLTTSYKTTLEVNTWLTTNSPLEFVVL